MKLIYLLRVSNKVVMTYCATVFLLMTAVITNAQNTQTPVNNDSKAEQIIQKAVEKLGGSRYLSIRTATSKGLYTLYKDGQALQTSTFVDYIVYPDKERTEFKTNGLRSIQTNVGNAGWIFDGALRTIKDMKAEQVKDFRDFTLRTSVETLLKGYWKKENAKLEYVGKREATLGRRNEVVRTTYPDGFIVEFEFSYENLPAKVVYKRQVEVEEKEDSEKKPEDESNEVKEEVRFAQFVDINGVFAPMIIDTYRAGKQTARVNFESVEYNKEIPESLFAKPATAKEIK